MDLRKFAVAAAVVAITVAACGSSSGTQAPATSEAPSLAAGPVTLTVMNWGNQGDPWWQARFAEFTKLYPNVSFKTEVVPYGDYQSKLGAYATSGSGPDVIQTEPGNILAYPQAHLDLTGRVDPANYAFTDPLCGDFDCSKAFYAIPWTLQAHPLYYNKSILTAAGLDPANPPKTWKDMDAACKKIEATGKACIAAGPKDYGGLTEMAALWNQTVTDPATECKGLLPGTSHGTDPWMVNAFALWKDMADRGWFQQGVADANLAPEAQDLFTSGGSAFYTGLQGDAYDWKVLGEVLKDDLAVYIGPQIEQDFPLQGVGPGPLSTSLDTSAGGGFAVTPWSKSQAEAIEFIKYLTDPAQGTTVTDVGSYPAAKGFDSSSIGNASLDQLVVLTGESKGNCTQYLPSSIFGPIIAQAQLLLTGETTPEKAGQAVEDSLVDLRP